MWDGLYCKQSRPHICHTYTCSLFAEWGLVETLDWYVVWKATDYLAGADPPWTQIVRYCCRGTTNSMHLLCSEIQVHHVDPGKHKLYKVRTLTKSILLGPRKWCFLSVESFLGTNGYISLWAWLYASLRRPILLLLNFSPLTFQFRKH